MTGRAELALQPASDKTRDLIRSKNQKEGLDTLIESLPSDDLVIALWSGSFGDGETRAFPGTFILTSRELHWRNDEGKTFRVTLATVDQMYVARVGRYAVHCVLVHGAHETQLVLHGEDDRSNRGASEFYEAVERAVEVAHSSIPSAVPGPPSSVADELAKLADLRDRGVLSPEEFEVQKRNLLDRRAGG